VVRRQKTEEYIKNYLALCANLCSDCHGARAHAGGAISDLRASALLGSDGWVDGGASKSDGMESFANVRDHGKVAAVRSWAMYVAQADQAT
jgi:mono/diheme cytochrome c family protein